MPRITTLDTILFPVEERPVFVAIQTKAGQKYLRVPNRKAIVNEINGRILGVVSKEYRVVTNSEALDLAYECCRMVFPEHKAGEWRVSTVDAPYSAGHCFIDMTHNSASLDFRDVDPESRPDAYGPFIRVTNSYNGMRALRFDIGFYRKICENGLILPESAIRFKFNHLQREIGKAIKLDIMQEKLMKMRKSFGENMKALREYPIDRSEFEPLMRSVLLIRKPNHAKPKNWEVEKNWNALQLHIKKMCDAYATELGENAYAVFNAITDFASHPPDNRCVYRERHSFQRLAGSWLVDFSRDCTNPGFDLKKYIEMGTRNNG